VLNTFISYFYNLPSYSFRLQKRRTQQKSGKPWWWWNRSGGNWTYSEFRTVRL